jgi:glycosyltransferase involved in cell wall biosynthesis
MSSDRAPSTPPLTVTMSVYNDERFVAEAIESILGQTFGAFEFLILNDGSTDRSGEIVEAYARRDARIRTIHRENRGLAASLNELTALAAGKRIARMDADDVSLPTRFERQIAFQDAHPEYGVVGTWCLDIGADGQSYGLNILPQPTDHDGFLEAIDERKPLLAHPTAITWTALARQVPYRPMFRYCEDHDLWLRLVARTKICSIGEHLYAHRYTPEQVSQKHSAEQLYGACVAYLAYGERRAGRPDPTEPLSELPRVEALDDLFWTGASRFADAWMAQSILYSETALKTDAFDHILRHVQADGSRDGLWRAALRLFRLGEPKRAARLALALIAK